MKKMNVLWLMSDQHNANCMSCADHPIVKTPHLDAIAQEGIRYTNAFANNPICAPSRICFMTGQHVHTHGYYGNQNNDCTDENRLFLPSVFRNYGYQTAMFGKAHLIRKWLDEGFEQYGVCDMIDAKQGAPESCHYFKYLQDHGLADYYEEGNPKPGQEYTHDGSAPAQLPYEHSIERFTGNGAIEFLKTRDTDRPFFLNVSFQRPHAPIAPAAEHFGLYNPADIPLPASACDLFERKFEGKPSFMQQHISQLGGYPLVCKDKAALQQVLASYYALISVIDAEIGRVIETLKELGEYENTIIFYTADHGDFAGEHGLFHKNLGIYESIQKIPFLLKVPGGAAGKTCEDLVESIDWYPTICKLCGVPTSDKVEGNALLAASSPNTDPDTSIVMEPASKTAIFCDWDFYNSTRAIAVRTKTRRLVYHANTNEGELYDHETDPDELINQYDNPTYNADRLALTSQLLTFAMGHAKRSDCVQDRKIQHESRFDPVVLLQRDKIYWSDLDKTYHTVKSWPPSKK